jgi:hypothetical protein
MLLPALDVGMTLGTEVPAGLEAEAIASLALCPEWILDMIARNCEGDRMVSQQASTCEGGKGAMRLSSPAAPNR